MDFQWVPQNQQIKNKKYHTNSLPKGEPPHNSPFPDDGSTVSVVTKLQTLRIIFYPFSLKAFLQNDFLNYPFVLLALPPLMEPYMDALTAP